MGKRDTSPETAPRSREVVQEVVANSEDRDPELATSADRKVTTPVTAPPRREVTATEVVVLSVDRDPALATSAEKRVTTPVTAPRNREVVVALSVDLDPVLATSAEKRDISPETAPRVTLPAVPEVAVEATVDPDLPVLATDVDKRVTSSLTALSPIPEANPKARTRTKRSDRFFPHSTH